MGGEFLIALALIGVIPGFVFAAWAAKRLSSTGIARWAFLLVIFLMGALLPTATFIGVGTLAKYASPTPNLATPR